MSNLKAAQKAKRYYTPILNDLQREAARGSAEACHQIIIKLTEYMQALKNVGYTYGDASPRLITIERYNKRKAKQP